MTSISVIIPCYRSAAFLEETVSELLAAFSEHPGLSPRLILVDDGSGDGTGEVILRLSSLHDCIVPVLLPENGGQAAARRAGLALAGSGPCVFMDDDGQHIPSDMFRLLAKLRQGYDLVYAQFPVYRAPFFRRLSSSLTNLVMTFRLRKSLFLHITSYFALSPAAVRVLKEEPPGTFLAAASVIRHFGARRVAGVRCGHRAGARASSSYTTGKLFRTFFHNLSA